MRWSRRLKIVLLLMLVAVGYVTFPSNNEPGARDKPALASMRSSHMTLPVDTVFFGDSESLLAGTVDTSSTAVPTARTAAGAAEELDAEGAAAAAAVGGANRDEDSAGGGGGGGASRAEGGGDGGACAVARVIHQTWKDKQVQKAFEPRIQSWLRTNPGWEYRFWTDADNKQVEAPRSIIPHCHISHNVAARNCGGSGVPTAGT